MKRYNASFVDCGCNYGAYSIPIAKKFSNQNIYAIDASRKAICNLKKNIQLNKINNIKYFNFGVGDKNKSKYFDDNVVNFKNDGSFRFIDKIYGKKIKIFTLDNFFLKEKVKINKNLIIKLDLEGFDFLAIKGLKKSFKKIKIIVFFEMSKMLIENSKNFKREFISFLKKENLHIYDLNFKIKNINSLIKSLNSNNNKRETIGDYIISNYKLKK